jgi:hypothetical protein
MPRALREGHASLGRTFWLFGVLIWLMLSLGLSPVVRHVLSLERVAPPVAIAGILALYLSYTCSVPFLIWKSANRFPGRRLWRVSAKVYAVLMYGVFLLPALAHTIPLAINPNTALVVNRLTPTPQMPYVGFWKVNRSEQFGVAIADAGNGFYSLSFCGPGGCFRPGEWRPNSTIMYDERYRVVDRDTIEFLHSIDEPTVYRRFTGGIFSGK